MGIPPPDPVFGCHTDLLISNIESALNLDAKTGREESERST